MKPSELGLGKDVADILQSQGIKELYPPQEESIGPALSGKNVVLAMPTASGKSLVAYLAIVKSVLKGGKALYIVPLRALASEKYDDLKAFEKLGIKVAISIGDFDSPDPTLEKFDVIIATSEKADSLLRHRAHWIERLTVVVADEIHLMNDGGRGPTLEITLSKLKQINPKAQIVALSATIKNSQEIADWLKAEHIQSDWRPVPLKEGVYYDEAIQFSDNSKREIAARGEKIDSLVADSLKEGGQCIIFVNTRRSSEAMASRLKRYTESSQTREEMKKSTDLARKIMRKQDEPTSIGYKLSRCVENGCAFHHAGLTNDQRKLIEVNFRNGVIKCVAATPTLAAGINLPARRVIIRDLTRFDENFGNVPIPVLEIKQMSGRAGRPQFDKEGEAVLIAKKKNDVPFIMENYLLGEPERIESKLGSEPALRMHILASIATKHVRNEEELMSFIESTFFAHQGDVWTIEDKIQNVLDFLMREEFVEGNGKLAATFFGKRTSDLYIDPLSAVIMRDALKVENNKVFPHLHAVCATPDMPKLYLRRGDYEWVEEKERKAEFLVDRDDYEFLLAEIKTASLIEEWIGELSEDRMIEKFGVGPGDIRRKAEMGEWLIYSMKELSRIFNKKKTKLLTPLILRIRYGIKEELLDLVSLRGIGRVRARNLFQSNFKTVNDLKKADENELARIPGLGKVIARSIKAQLGGAKEITVEEVIEEAEGQSSLSDFS
ncbi:MAG: DEAD/DEAH box helicase [Methanomassiliicoccales archaeon]|nr:MAG: DEAD/DEAH box helicase [Methanomassiliicoccales archaeon]